MYKNIALVLAGGSGSRLGTEVPKQYLEVGGKHVIGYCLETFARHTQIDGIWVVAQEEWHGLIKGYAADKIIGFSEPGMTRQLSIWNGMKDMRKFFEKGKSLNCIRPEEAESGNCCGHEESGCQNCGGLGNSEAVFVDQLVVLIHDAARPLVSLETITACLQGCQEHDGVMPALPVKDTVYYGVDGRIEALLDRSKVIAGQAPEAFRFAKYYEANRVLLSANEERCSMAYASVQKDDALSARAPILKINGSTEPAVLAGLDVQYIPGDERNFKITTQADLDRFREIVEA